MVWDGVLRVAPVTNIHAVEVHGGYSHGVLTSLGALTTLQATFAAVIARPRLLQPWPRHGLWLTTNISPVGPSLILGTCGAGREPCATYG